MLFKDTIIKGCKVIDLESFKDSRGTFSRVYCTKEFEEEGLKTDFVQSNLSSNFKSGTLRGMHYQKVPYQEVKLVKCLKGSIFDVVVDLRKNSPSYLKWFGAELSEKNGTMMYVPQGCAHGYQSLEENTLIHYMVNSFYEPSFEGGLYYDDPLIKIKWPLPISDISEKDKSWKLL